MGDAFCLKWNNHQTTLVSVFDKLFECESLVDCTLAAEGRQLKAHKVVLSACSPYLEDLIRNHEDKHPIIIFNSISFEELKAMLEYMYRGEVNVSQEQLDSFLKVAESLKIKGLTDQGGGPKSAADKDDERISKKRRQRTSSDSTQSEEKELLKPELKSEPIEEANTERIEDLTIDEEDEDFGPPGPGTSQGSFSSQDFNNWHITGDATSDEMFMAAQQDINSQVNPNQVEVELSSLSNPLAVIVLREDEVLEEGVGEEEVIEEEDMSTLEIYNEQSKIICHYCGAEFAEEAELDKHSSSCTSNLQYECAICGATFLSEQGLRSHVRVHADGSTCERCGKYFRTPVSLEAHQKEECGQEQTLECILCSRCFPSKSQLNAHLIESHSEAKIVTPEVHEEIRQSQSSEEQYQCKLCPRSFTRVGSLNYHVSRQHSGDNQRSAEDFPYLCMNCGNRYKSSTQLCRHRRWECGKEPLFKCQLCVKKFHHRHGLKQHIRLHMAKKGQSFESKSVTTAQFCCEKCGRGYKLKSSLNNHIKWECGKEPVFPCSVCHVRFSHKGNLKKHILTKHVGKQPLSETRKEE